MAVMKFRSAWWVFLGLWILAGCGEADDPNQSGQDAGTSPITQPRFHRRTGFVPGKTGDPFIAVRWAGEGHVADNLPPAVVGATAGQNIADIGFGNGRHALRIAKVLGEEGRIYCRDIDARAVKALDFKAGPNMDVALSEEGDVRLPARTIDTLLMCDTYHLIHRLQQETRDAFIASLYRSLKPGGVMVICYLFAGVFNDRTKGQEFVSECDTLFARHGFELGRRWRFDREWSTPLLFEYRRPPN